MIFAGQFVSVIDRSAHAPWSASTCAEHGQDNAIMPGFRIARGKYVAVMDDDLQHHPDLPALLSRIEGFDVVYAEFRAKKQKLWNAGSWFNGRLAEWVINKHAMSLSIQDHSRRSGKDDLITRARPYIDGLLSRVTANRRYRSIITALRRPQHAWKSLRVWARLAVSLGKPPTVTWFGLLCAVLNISRSRLSSIGCGGLKTSPPSGGWASMVALLVVNISDDVGADTGRTFLNVNRKPQSAIREVLNAAAAEESLEARALSTRR
jgi:undecaprenyl-phosphate 4-deoxy-4-formamido-L-arabinose transferase